MSEQRLTPADLPKCLETEPVENRRFYMLCPECNQCWIQRENPKPRCRCQNFKRLQRCEFTCVFHPGNTAYFYGFHQDEATFSCLNEECTPYIMEGYCCSNF